MTIVKKSNEEFSSQAKDILLKGGLVAFPTETVYGLGADATNEKACEKIYIAKGRPSDNPLIVHIGDIDQLEQLVKDISDDARKLIDKFWPGPLTIIFNKSEIVPKRISGGLDTVAVRMPSNNVALKLLKDTKIPIAAPSANISGKPSPTSAEHVLNDLDGKIDMVIDGGNVDIGIESTIIDMTEKYPKILRPGHITAKMLEETLGYKVDYDDSSKDKPKAPGMKYKHYSPKGNLILLDGAFKEIVKYINMDLQTGIRENIAIITTDEYKDKLSDIFLGVSIFSYGNGEIEQASKNLYKILRECDDEDIKVIYSVVFPKKGRGYSLMNRLEKAAASRLIKLGKIDRME